MILLLTGPDDFSRREALTALKAAHDRDGGLATNTVTLNGASITLAELRAAATTVPFLAEYRLVVVEGLCRRFDARNGAGRRRRDVGDWTPLADLLAAVPDTTLLVFVEDAVRLRNPIREMIDAAGEVREFPLPAERQLAPWVRDRARALGLDLTPAAVRLLVERVGRNLWVLASEVDKLKTYAGADTVDEPDVRALVARSREGNIFRLVDGVAEGRGSVALQALERLRDEGEAPQRIIAMLARQFRMLVVAREILDRGGSPADVQEQLKVQDFVARRVVEQARRFSLAALGAAMQRILRCEVQIQDYWQDRPGGMPQDLAVELLVADLAGLGRRRAAAARR